MGLNLAGNHLPFACFVRLIEERKGQESIGGADTAASFVGYGGDHRTFTATASCGRPSKLICRGFVKGKKNRGSCLGVAGFIVGPFKGPGKRSFY